MKKRVGFVGLGIMGKPMAKNLLKAGYNVVVNDINVSAMQELVDMGAEGAATAGGVAEISDVCITMLPASSHVREVVLVESGILAMVRPGYILIDMSSVTPAVSREIAAKAAEKGVCMLDAPVSGGETKAIDGTLAIMAGGEQETFDEVKDIFMALGSSAVLVGGHGSGSIAKLANQVIVNLNIAAMSEALVLAVKAGVDPGKLYEAIRGGLAGSVVLDAKVPLILKRNFVAGGRIDINLKDLRNVMETAHEIGVSLPLASQLTNILLSLKVEGKSGLDHGAIVQFYERLSGVEVRGLE